MTDLNLSAVANTTGIGRTPATDPSLGRGRSDDRLDDFASRAGPDVAVGDYQLTRVFAVFQEDPHTHQMKVSVVDESGNLVRIIPPDSVAEMIAAMGAYGRRHIGP